MSKNTITLVSLFILMLFLQVICNRICLFNIAVPYVYIYFILRLPISLSVNWVMTLSFLIGLCVDVFSNTYGMNAMACTIVALCRKPIIGLFCQREDEINNPTPSLRTLGLGVYMKYIFTFILLFCLCIYTIQLFTFNNFLLMFFRIVGSTILTTIIVFGFDSIATTRREKRL